MNVNLKKFTMIIYIDNLFYFILIYFWLWFLALFNGERPEFWRIRGFWSYWNYCMAFNFTILLIYCLSFTVSKEIQSSETNTMTKVINFLIIFDRIFRYSVNFSKLSNWGNFSSGQRGIHFSQKCTTVLKKMCLLRGIWFEQFIFSTLLKKKIYTYNWSSSESMVFPINLFAYKWTSTVLNPEAEESSTSKEDHSFLRCSLIWLDWLLKQQNSIAN